MSNIEGLNEEESEWVNGAMSRLKVGKIKHGECPSEKAWDKLQNNLTECGIQKKNISYRS